MVITVSILLTVFAYTTSGQIVKEQCSIDVQNMTADELILSAPEGWTFGCLSRKHITQALEKGNKHHVNGIIECLHPNFPVCETRGYEILADEVFRRIDGGGKCIDCTPYTNDLVDFAMRSMQEYHPRELKKMLSYLG